MSKKNKTLSKLIKLKENRKIQIELEVKKAADSVEEEQNKLNELEGNYENSVGNFAERQVDSVLNAGNMSVYYDFFSRINRRIKDQEKECSRSQDNLEKSKDRLVDAHKEKKAVEMLNDKQIKKELRERSVSEQKETDYFSLIRRIK
ncbi:MAG: flagellar export protein FliJ [Nitrospiraceae bacterium]|nr:MAG: flagellar export protein FliJ [Nitrospiraceae bacterium]